MPFHMFPKGSRGLLILFLLHASLHFNLTSAGSSHIPKPLPESQWVGKTNLNYTELYNDHIDGVMCSFIPVGVFGTYAMIATFIINIFTYAKIETISSKLDGQSMILASTRRRGRSAGGGLADMEQQAIKENDIKRGYYVTGFLTSTWAIYILVTHIQSHISCKNTKGFHILEGVSGVIIAQAVLAAISGLLLLICSRSVVKVGEFFFVFSHLLAYVAAWMMYFNVLSKAGILSQVSQSPDQIGAGALAVAFIPFIFFVLCQLYCWKDLKFSEHVALVVAFHMPVIFLTLGNVQVAKMVGDPWGVYAVKNAWGAALAAMSFVIPGIEGLVVAMGI